MKKFTYSEKAAGEMAVRTMSLEAQMGYNETEPLEVFKSDDGIYVKTVDGIDGPMTEAEAEDNYNAILEKLLVNGWCESSDFVNFIWY